MDVRRQLSQSSCGTSWQWPCDSWTPRFLWAQYLFYNRKQAWDESDRRSGTAWIIQNTKKRRKSHLAKKPAVKFNTDCLNADSSLLNQLLMDEKSDRAQVGFECAWMCMICVHRSLAALIEIIYMKKKILFDSQMLLKAAETCLLCGDNPHVSSGDDATHNLPISSLLCTQQLESWLSQINKDLRTGTTETLPTDDKTCRFPGSRGAAEAGHYCIILTAWCLGQSCSEDIVLS